MAGGLVPAVGYAAGGPDAMLGAFEVVAVPLSLVWLLLAATAHPLSPRRLRRAVIAALIVGGTVAQPFGAVAAPITVGDFAFDTTRCVSPAGWHVLPVGPIRVPFRLYVRHRTEDDAGRAV